MPSFVDFAEIKSRVGFEQVISLLGLKMKRTGNQWRGPCTICQKGGERALVVTEGKGFFCFGSHTGGDQIAFVAHIRSCPVKDAAIFLSQETFPDTVPEKVVEHDAKALAPLPYLEHDHDAVVAIGFDLQKAKQLGIGYAGRGIMRGTIAVPLRDEHGTLVGYIGVEDCRLPPNLMANVVEFGKKSA